MSSLHVKEHIVLCPRLPRAAEISTRSVQLLVKQYYPQVVLAGSKFNVTIVAAHANGFSKELYEPLWNYLHAALASRNIGITSIWIADAAYQGASLALNESSQFMETSWQDHSEDLLHVMKHFSEQMQQPIIGIGHSMGGCQIAALSVISRGIFGTMILLDPAIGPPEAALGNLHFGKVTLRRRTQWPTRKDAEKALNKHFGTWDPQVLGLFTKHSIQRNANAIEKDKDSVGLITGRYQELVNFIKPSFIRSGKGDDQDVAHQTGPADMYHMLGLIACSTLYMCGEESTLSIPTLRKLWLDRTATLSYSKEPSEVRKVEEKIVQGTGHFLAMEKPLECADVIAQWISKDQCIVRDRCTSERGKEWRKLSDNSKRTVAEDWMAYLRLNL